MSLTVSDTSSSSQFNSGFEVVVDDDETKSDRMVRNLFSQYSKLLTLQETYNKKIQELKFTKKELKKNCLVYLYEKEPSGIPKCVFIAMVGGPIAFTGIGLGIYGFISGNSALMKGGLSLMPIGIGVTLTLLRFPPICVKNKLDAYYAAKNELPNVIKKGNQISQWIECTRIFTKLHIEWSNYTKLENDESKKRLFKQCHQILDGFRSDLIALDEGGFMNVALISLMNKVCIHNPGSNLANSWNELIATPALWGGKKDVEVWKLVGLKNPYTIRYLQFYENKGAAYTDPGKWNEWLDSCIKEYIDENLTNT